MTQQKWLYLGSLLVILALLWRGSRRRRKRLRGRGLSPRRVEREGFLSLLGGGHMPFFVVVLLVAWLGWMRKHSRLKEMPGAWGWGVLQQSLLEHGQGHRSGKRGRAPIHQSLGVSIGIGVRKEGQKRDYGQCGDKPPRVKTKVRGSIRKRTLRLNWDNTRGRLPMPGGLLLGQIKKEPGEMDHYKQKKISFQQANLSGLVAFSASSLTHNSNKGLHDSSKKKIRKKKGGQEQKKKSGVADEQSLEK